MAADGLRFHDFEARQNPNCFAESFVVFKAKLDELPARHRLRIYKPQFRFGFVVESRRK